MKKLVPLLLSGALLFSLDSCKKDKETTAVAAQAQQTGTTGEENTFPREKTLYIVGFEDSDPSSFNPLNDWPAWPIRPEFNLMYETVLSYNSMTGENEPLLGRLDERNNDYVSVMVNPSAKWSDGVQLTAKDVKFSFEMGVRYPSLPSSYVNGFIGSIGIDTVYSVKSTDASGKIVYTKLAGKAAVSGDTIMEERVKFFVDKKGRNNPLVIVDLLSSITILPEHVFEPLFQKANGDLSELQEEKMDSAQVVSGPYNLFGYSNEKIVIKRRADYWGNAALYGGKQPAPEYIIHPIYKGNDHANAALKHGKLDISSNFLPRIWLKMARQKNVDGVKRGVQAWYDSLPYFVPGSIPMFIINTTKAPLNDRVYRRAMALSVDYGQIARLAVSGYTPELNSGLILPFSDESKFYDSAEVKKHGVSRYDVAAAKKMLKDAGYKSFFNAKGDLDSTTGPDGKKLPTVYIKSPSGWSDFESIVKLAVKSMRSAGIDIREGFVDASLYWPSMHTGDFDLLMDTPAARLSASMPWSRFEAIMSSAEWEPIGGKMYVNMGRFNNPKAPDYIKAVDSILAAVPHMTDDAQKKVAYTELNRIFMEEQPTIPLCYRPEEFYEFNNSHWENFATEKNPYAPPHMPCGGAARKMLWEIKPVVSKEGK